MRELEGLFYKLYVWSAISLRTLVDAFQFSFEVASSNAFSRGFFASLSLLSMLIIRLYHLVQLKSLIFKCFKHFLFDLYLS